MPYNQVNYPYQFAPYTSNFNAQNCTPAPNYIQGPYAQMQPVNTIPGRVVQSLDQVTAHDLPAVGSVSLFPKSDWSSIWAKWWDANGQIQTIEFVPKTAVSTQKSVTVEDLSAKLDTIEKTIRDMNGRQYNKPYKKPDASKETEHV